ncbi:MAG: hypothetical protein IJ629_04310 [Clostridia bacterium]|nr:hypothetical protein [Clostridia bacterium]
MVIRKTIIDFGALRVKFQDIRNEIARSKHLPNIHREILLTIYDKLLEGIDHKKFSSYTDMTIFSVQIEYKDILIKVKYRLSELYKSYQDVPDMDGLINEIERTAKECGLSVKRKGRKVLEELEVYLKTNR